MLVEVLSAMDLLIRACLCLFRLSNQFVAGLAYILNLGRVTQSITVKFNFGDDEGRFVGE